MVEDGIFADELVVELNDHLTSPNLHPALERPQQVIWIAVRITLL